MLNHRRYVDNSFNALMGTINDEALKLQIIEDKLGKMDTALRSYTDEQNLKILELLDKIRKYMLDIFEQYRNSGEPISKATTTIGFSPI